MAEKLLDTEQVLERVPFGRTWLDERIAEGTFPKPKHKWRRNLWLESIVDDWIIKNFGDDPKDLPTLEQSPAAH